MSHYGPQDVAPSAALANAGTTARAVLIGVAGWMVGKGWLTEDTAQALIPVVLGALPVIWGFIKNYNTKKTIQKAIDAPAGVAK